jgi:hypothetical protein
MFPSRPTDRDIELLHRYGIDCLHLTSSGTFLRREAPATARSTWLGA